MKSSFPYYIHNILTYVSRSFLGYLVYIYPSEASHSIYMSWAPLGVKPCSQKKKKNRDVKPWSGSVEVSSQTDRPRNFAAIISFNNWNWENDVTFC